MQRKDSTTNKKSGRTHLDVLKRGGFDGITVKKATGRGFGTVFRPLPSWKVLDINVERKVSCCRPPGMWLKLDRSEQTQGGLLPFGILNVTIWSDGHCEVL